jgi:Insertion element 4 transposase N-terminal/Transposase DDE domain
VQSAMPVCTAAIEAGGAGDGHRLREAVLAGPGGVVQVEQAAAGEVWSLLADPRQIAAGLATAGHVDRRQRALPGAVTVLAVLALCLFRRENYDLVLARVFASTSMVRAVDGVPPTGQALSQARTRLTGQPLQALFTQTVAAAPTAPIIGMHLFDLLLCAFDGTVLDVANTAENCAVFTVPTGGRFPQARLVTLVACGTRRILAAAVDSAGVSEQALVDRLAADLRPGMLNLADRNFFAMHRWVRFTATGAQLAWRVKNGARSLPARVVEVLPDGSARVLLHESDEMLAARRRKAGDRSLARLPDTIARLVEFTVTVTDRRGRATTSRFRVLTTLLDHHRYPAGQIAAAYAHRWQAEVAYLHLKVTLRGAGTRLRGQSPHLARQEIWGLLIVYNALVDLATRAAVDLGVHPDRISFTAVLALTRNSMAATATTCDHCGHQPTGSGLTETLLAAITVHPLGRAGRQRTSPRSRQQRRTERTRTVSYTIEIVASNLPRAE